MRQVKLLKCFLIGGLLYFGNLAHANDATSNDISEENEFSRLKWLVRNCPAAADVVVKSKHYFYSTIQENNVSIPFTHVNFEINESLYNPQKINLTDIKFPGGKIDNHEVWLSHSPNEITPGDSLVIFYGTYQEFISPCSGDLGVFKVVNGFVEGTQWTVKELKDLIQQERRK